MFGTYEIERRKRIQCEMFLNDLFNIVLQRYGML